MMMGDNEFPAKQTCDRSFRFRLRWPDRAEGTGRPDSECRLFVFRRSDPPPALPVKVGGTVARYAVEATHFLEQQGANLLVIACNTATALALDQITRSAHVPVIGVVEPGAEQASSASKNRRVVVVGTETPSSRHAYLKALQRRDIQAREKACPLLVPLVEEGWVEHPVTEQVARIYLQDAFGDGFHDADVLVLGCTHYPLIKPLLRRVATAHVNIVDSAHSTASAVAERVGDLYRRISSQTSGHAELEVFRNGFGTKVSANRTKLLGHPVNSVEHVDLKE